MNIKIVVAGAFSSGKTQLCDTLAGRQPCKAIFSEDGVGMDYWDFAIDTEKNIQLFTPPGARRFDNIWEILAEDLFGFIVMVDSSKPETFRECKSILETFLAYAPVPYVIAANKQDLETAWDIEALRHPLRLSPDVPIIPCVATHRKSVANVLLALCEEALRDLDDEAEA